MHDVPSECHPDHSACGQEQVQVIGCIQPFGILFALSEPELVVRQVSANVASCLGKSAEMVLGKPFDNVIGALQFEAFQSAIQDNRPIIALAISLPTSGGVLDFDCIVHRQGSVLIAELEFLQGAHSLGLLDIDSHVRNPLGNIERARDFLELWRLAASEIQQISGFDRVMVYRFDEEWNGEVIAEIKDSAAASYYGQRFPASDIPPQVRRLFLINTLRTIADVDATPIEIEAEVESQKGRSLDLTRSLLRSASPTHLEYLRNMSVKASLTVSVVVKGRLWGMIACHHRTPRRVDRSIRSLAELIAQSLASQVALRLDNDYLQRSVSARDLLEKYTASIETSQSFVGDHAQLIQLLHLVEADAAILQVAEATLTQGALPEKAALTALISNLQNNALHGIASSDCLGTLRADAASYAREASGALYIGFGDSGDYLILLRRELLTTLVWAGNPNTAVSTDDKQRLHPRASFAAWRETVRGRSRPWTAIELQSASHLREQLTRISRTEALALLTARFNVATRAAHIGVFERDADSGESWWSEEMWEIIGHAQGAFRTTFDAWLSLVHPEDRERVRATTGSTHRGRTSANIRYRIMRPDGAIRYVESIGSVAEQKHKAANRIAGMMIDVTERVESEERERVLQHRLRESSRQAGKAEVATGVLHNVGNVLNSLGVANAVALRELKSLRLDRLEQASSMILSNRATLAVFFTEDVRGRHLPDYLSVLTTQLASSVQTIRGEATAIERLLHHLRDVVGAQQEHAKVGGVTESIDLRDVVESALLVQSTELGHIDVVRLYEELPPVNTDRNKLLQILVNFISNARDAIQLSPAEPRRIIVRVYRDRDNAVIAVEDSGCGMSAEVLSGLWQFGFTTKQGGHGFGLHNSANTAHEIGATINAQSEGPGKGSQFTLRWPIVKGHVGDTKTLGFTDEIARRGAA